MKATVKRAGSQLWPPLYHLLLYPLYVNAMRVVAISSAKVRRALKGRSNWRDYVGRIRSAEAGEFRLHFHAASVGEFEQAKPLIDEVRRQGLHCRITASFFSPSGLEQQGKYPGLDGACYLPHDRQGEMSEFMNRLSPDLIIIMRYDLWLEFLRQARMRMIPIVLACGVLRSNSTRFRFPVRAFFERVYRQLTVIYAVSEEDRRAFAELAPSVQVEVSGDTRYDRVIARSLDPATFDGFAPEVINGRTMLIAGSTWRPDEDLLMELTERKDLLLVIVPHEPTPQHVAALIERFPGAMTLSDIEGGARGDVRTIVVDRTGILSALYRLGHIAYVGGGFGDGVHSVLEPAVYGIPVLCGPRIERSRDAVAMREAGVLSIVRVGGELRDHVFTLLDDEEKRGSLGATAREFVWRHAGAAERILNSLQRRSLLKTFVER